MKIQIIHRTATIQAPAVQAIHLMTIAAQAIHRIATQVAIPLTQAVAMILEAVSALILVAEVFHLILNCCRRFYGFQRCINKNGFD